MAASALLLRRTFLASFWLAGTPLLVLNTAWPAVEAIDNPRLFNVVGGHLQFNPVTRDEANKSFAHLARNVGENQVTVLQFHTKHGARQYRVDSAFEFYGFFVFSHKKTVAVWILYPESEPGGNIAQNLLMRSKNLVI